MTRQKSKSEFIKRIFPLSTSEICDLSGIGSQVIKNYANTEIVIPTESPTGRGKVRKYDKKNLIEILISYNLSQKGIFLKTVKRIIRAIQDLNPPGIDWVNPEKYLSLNQRLFLIIYNFSTDALRVEMKLCKNPYEIENFKKKSKDVQKVLIQQFNTININMTSLEEVIVIDVTILAKKFL